MTDLAQKSEEWAGCPAIVMLSETKYIVKADRGI